MKTIRSNKPLTVAKIAAVLTTTLYMTACSSELLITDAVSTIATDKTLGDHVVSIFSHKDCSSVRKELGLTYCKEDDLQLKKEKKQYCYNELGKVTCYENADLYSVRKDVEDKKEPTPQWK